MLKKDFGQNVRYYRKEKNLTLETAAELCEISSRYLGRIERGKQAATIDVIEKISKGLNVPVEKLLAARNIGKDSITGG